MGRKKVAKKAVVAEPVNNSEPELDDWDDDDGTASVTSAGEVAPSVSREKRGGKHTLLITDRVYEYHHLRAILTTVFASANGARSGRPSTPGVASANSRQSMPSPATADSPAAIGGSNPPSNRTHGATIASGTLTKSSAPLASTCHARAAGSRQSNPVCTVVGSDDTATHSPARADA